MQGPQEEAGSSANIPPITASKKTGETLIWMALFVFTIVGGCTHLLINDAQPGPYMDEVFHVPQTQLFCEGTFSEWDPKITTLPGTYIISGAILAAWDRFAPLGKGKDLCSTLNLRAFNLGVSIFNLWLIYCIIRHYNPELCPLKRVASAVNIATFPVLYFFSFLYYTDALSTTFLLLMHLFYLNGKLGSSALAGSFSVFCRQTNIVWVFFHGINTILDILTKRYGEMIFLIPLIGKKFFMSMRSSGRASKGKRNAKTTKKATKSARPSTGQIPSLRRIWKDCGAHFIYRGYGYILVGVLFLVFVVYNGGIVVGDKQAHQASLNIPQMFYFALVFGTFTLPFMASRVRVVGTQILENPRNFFTLFAIFAVVIFFNSPAHPYLLADNRHYTFYVWKRFYERMPFLRYMWIPFYIMVWTLITTSMGVPKVILFNYIFCTFINLAPQLLMEFRYFIPSYLFARMTFKNPTWYELALEFAIYTSFNYLTLFIFINVPFRWSDSADVQRFMW